DANRRLLQEIRANDPEHYARLRASFERFQALPAERREKIRQLDRQLQEEDSQTQARLMCALAAYTSWLMRLPESDRQHIQSAASAEERLKIVREIRQQQWLQTLPRAQQDEYKAAPANQKAELAAKWRAEER